MWTPILYPTIACQQSPTENSPPGDLYAARAPPTGRVAAEPGTVWRRPATRSVATDYVCSGKRSRCKCVRDGGGIADAGQCRDETGRPDATKPARSYHADALTPRHQ